MKYKYYGLGRRKSAIAKVYIGEVDPGRSQELGWQARRAWSLDNIIVNKKKFFDYFQNDPHFIQKIQQILKLPKAQLYIKVTVSGGGSTGQKDAISLALVRALGPWGFHSIFKKKNLLTQDARRKERKKYGLKKARKAPQYSKR